MLDVGAVGADRQPNLVLSQPELFLEGGPALVPQRLGSLYD